MPSKKAPTKKKTDNLSFVGSTYSKYRDIIDMCLKLKVGESIVCPVPKGVTLATYRNRLSAAVNKQVKPVLQKGKNIVRIRSTDDNQVAVSLERK